LTVRPGSGALITRRQLDAAVDLRAEGVVESGVVFRVIKPPSYGDIHVEDVSAGGSATEETAFTLLDLNTDKVFYQHDGESASSKDSAVLEVQLTPSGNAGGTREQRFIFDILVAAEAAGDESSMEEDEQIKGISADSSSRPTRLWMEFDLALFFLTQKDRTTARPSTSTTTTTKMSAPRVSLRQPVRPLRLPRGSSAPLQASLLDVSTGGAPPSNVILYIVRSPGGHVRSRRQPGIRAGEFTLSELMDGEGSYVDHGGVAGRRELGLRVASTSGGQGNLVTLGVITFEIEVLEVNNTGLVVASGDSGLITPSNLTFATNSPEQGLNIR